VHCGVAGDDLFDQRASRTGHAQDKDRQRRRVAAAELGGDQFWREHRLNAVEQSQDGGLVLAKAAALGRVASEQVSERAGMVVKVRIGLAEREVIVRQRGMKVAAFA
jgi:hypothetical protein